MEGLNRVAKCTFIEDACSLGAKEHLAALLYDTLVHSFSVKAPTLESDLYKAFGIVDDELDQLVISVAQAAGLRLPTAAEMTQQSAVRSVKDLLLFLNGFEPRGDAT
ncbi:hypothetical protein AACH06_12040 [Ideonella sp. DXS29W]|uniref:Acyl carrier protein n=1 Tax=Ideonella lacteola TaxID=2984193 RepID=A0ABU9BP64_9BURK